MIKYKIKNHHTNNLIKVIEINDTEKNTTIILHLPSKQILNEILNKND